MQDDHNLVIHFLEYKSKKYPIKYEFFQKYLQNYPKKGNDDIIPLIDNDSYDDIDLTEESINSFISCVQHGNIIITNDNLVPLNYLAKKYSVGPLINQTNINIEKETQFILNYFLKHQDEHHFKSKAYEEVIEENFPKCIKNEQFLDFNIQILYRIFHQYTINHGQFVNNQILDFLFIYLEKFKIKASPLFEFVQFSDDTKSYLDKLMNKEREGIFDIKFLNPSVIHYLHDKSSQIDDCGKYHVGDVLKTMRDLSDDKSWLECDGRFLNENEHGQLCSLMKPTPDEGKWRHHSVLNKQDKYLGRFCNATDGEYFVFVETNNPRSIFVYSTKNFDDENWVSKQIELPDGYYMSDQGNISLRYLNGEFVISILMKNDNSNIIYVLRAKKPDENWIHHLIQIEDLPKFDIDLCFCYCYFMNNVYVILFKCHNCGDVERGFVILYGPNFSTLKMNKKFCYKSETNYLPQIAYGNGKWAISMVQYNITNKIYKSLIYVSDDINSLSPDSKDYNLLLHWGEKEKGFYPTQFVYSGGKWVIVGFNEIGSDYNVCVYWIKDDPLFSINTITFEEYDLDYYHNLYYLNGAFYFIAENKSDHTVYLFYSTDQNLAKENWKLIQVCNSNIKGNIKRDLQGIKNEYSLSCNEQRNCLFAVIRKDDDDDSKFIVACYSPGSSHRLPKIDPVAGIKTYIKSNEK